MNMIEFWEEDTYTYVLCLRDSKKSSNVRELTQCSDPHEKISDVGFLIGEFLYYSEEFKTGFIVSYKSLDKRILYLTAVHTRPEVVWHRDFSPENPDKNPKLIKACSAKGNNLLFGVNGILYSVDIRTGDVNWTREY